ncbi:MAG: hypothetical protein INR65_14450 [Gluconacetobacter diazotrophicus]|nr:hypothetical protein [Gluconacetobacter diazotrophicus]
MFRSASAIPSDFQDRRFLPAGPLDALLIPWAVATGRAPTAEVAFADPRVLAVVPLAAAALLAGLGRVRSRLVPARAGTPPIVRALVFGAVSYGVWLRMFAIERYAVPIEILAGMLAVLLAVRLVPARAALPVAAAGAILLVAATRPADWGHRPWSAPFHPVLPAPLREPATFLVVSHPVGYWVSILPPGSRFLLVERDGLATGGVLRTRLLDGLDHAPGGRLRTLGEDAPMDLSTREQLRSLGVVVEPSCVHLGGLDGTPILSCAASRPGSRPLAATDLLPDVPVDMSDRGNGWPLLLDGWGTPAADGTPAIAADAVLLLRVPDQPEPRVLELTAATPAPDTLRVAVDGREAASWALAGAGRAATGGVCLPPRAAGPFRVRLRSGSVGLVLRQLRLRDAEPGECPA